MKFSCSLNKNLIKIKGYSQTICRILFRKLKKLSPTYFNSKWNINRIKDFQITKIQRFLILLENFIRFFTNDLPKLDYLNSLEIKLIDICINKKYYFKARTALKIIIQKISRLGKEYIQIIKTADSPYRCNNLKKAFFGIFTKILQRNDEIFTFLLNSKLILNKLILHNININSRLIINLKINQNNKDEPYLFTYNNYRFTIKNKIQLNSYCSTLSYIATYKINITSGIKEIINNFYKLIMIILGVYTKSTIILNFDFKKYDMYSFYQQLFALIFLKNIFLLNYFIINVKNINLIELSEMKKVFYILIKNLQSFSSRIINISF